MYIYLWAVLDADTWELKEWRTTTDPTPTYDSGAEIWIKVGSHKR